MSAYVIFDVGPSDREAMQPYLDKAWDTVASHGGQVRARTSNTMFARAPTAQAGGPLGC